MNYRKEQDIRSSLQRRIRGIEIVYKEELEDQKQFTCKDQKIRNSLCGRIRRLEIVYNVQENIRELEKYLRGSIRGLEKYLRGSIRGLEKYLRGILEDQQFTRKYQNIRRVGYKQDIFKSVEDFVIVLRLLKTQPIIRNIY